MRAELEAFHDGYCTASAAFRNGDTLAAFPAYSIKPPQAWPDATAVGWTRPDDHSAEATTVADCERPIHHAA